MKAYVIKFYDNIGMIKKRRLITIIAKDSKEMAQKFNDRIEDGQYKMIELLHETEVIL